MGVRHRPPRPPQQQRGWPVAAAVAVAVAAVVGSVVTRHAAADVVLTDADLCDTYSGGLCTIASMKVLVCRSGA